ncbi:TRAPP subunit trs31 [Lobulomyces angularis]|nr:TRAPP subunit trs31 [Lobulomyces angularis]
MNRPKQQQSIFDRPLNKTRNNEVFPHVIKIMIKLKNYQTHSEMLQYSQKSVNGIQELEKKLSDFGYKVGLRELELTAWREKNTRRETKVLGILSFVHSTIWKSLFGKVADALEKSSENEDEYMLSDNDPLVSKYISIPRELALFNSGAFIGGIVEAILDGSNFPCRVTAHSTANDQFPLRTTFLIKFDKTVMQREKEHR